MIERAATLAPDQPIRVPQFFPPDEIARYYREMTPTYMNYGGGALAFHTALVQDAADSKEAGLRRSNEVLSAGLGLKPNDLVLDAGSGMGGLAFHLAERHGVRVVGVTLCADHAKASNRLAAQRGLAGRIGFELMDFMDLDFPDDTFDAVLCQESFCYAHDQARFLAGVRRILKPGGRWRALDVFRTRASLDPPMEQALALIQRGWKTPPFQRIGQTVRIARRLGFKDAFERDHTPLVRVAAEGFIREKIQFDLARRLGFYEATEERPASRAFEQHMEACAAYGVGVLKGTLAYRLVGAAKPLGNLS